SAAGLETDAATTPPPDIAPAAELPPEPPPAAPKPPAPPRLVGKARAVAGKGAVIVGQDGTTVKYRKKCTACGFEDSCWHSMRITPGVTGSAFFCPKCKKRREVQIQGYSG